MIKKILDGIISALHTEFGENHEIYTESIEQGLKEPCFFISILNPTDELFLNNKHYRTHNFMIQYFPFTDEINDECYDVLERMYDCLELIKVGNDLVRGSNKGAEIVDNVLNFNISYDMYVYKVKENSEPNMEELNQNVGV